MTALLNVEKSNNLDIVQLPENLKKQLMDFIQQYEEKRAKQEIVEM